MKQKLLLALLALFTLGGSNLFAQEWSASDLENGKYVFLNVGSGRYLGPGNSWGTQASLIECSHYNTLAKVSDGVYTIESQVSNGGTAYYFSGTYMDGAAVNVTIQDNGEGIFTMSTDGSYYGYDGSTTVLANDLTDPTSTNAQWKIMAYDDVYADASEENPIDVTYMILDSNFDRNNRNETKVADNNWTGAWTMNASNQNLSGGDDTNRCAESWRSTFTLSQAITVPNGYYKLRAQAALTEYTVTDADFPVVYATSSANTVTSPFNKMVNGESSMTTMSTQFTSGNYWTNYTNVITVSNKSLTIGVKGTRTDTWCIWDNFQLIYMGPIDLTEFANQLAAAVAAAEATEGTIPTAAYNAIAAVVEENNKTYEDEEGYSTAITAINNAVATYASPEIVAAYSNYTTIKAAVLAINSGIDVSNADALANDGTDANLDDAIAALRSATANYLSTTTDNDIDITAVFVTNPGFELGNVNGWTNSGNQAAGAQGNKVFDNTQGNYYAERWHAAGTVDLNQTVTGLAAGVYEIGAYLYTDTSDGKLNANDVHTNFSTSGWYTVNVAVDANGSIKFGASCTLTGSTWICMDGFKLTYKGGLPDVTAVEGKMNKDVAAAQTEAITAYNAERTVANYNAAIAAINAAQASVDAYASAATAINKAKEIKNNHNFATADALTTFADAIAAIENSYNEGTLTDDVAKNAGITLGTAVSAWHGNNNAAAVVYLRDGFSLGDFEADPALHVNTWSTEGDNDGSGFSVPFYESWTAASSLPESTITGSLSDLPTGLYKVSALVRVCANNEAAATEATGVTMNVNGGTAVDVTEGNQVGDSQFQLKSYEAEGLVKDGNLTVTFNIAADNNIYWLSFKNVKYVKERDLTPEEMAVVPTGITLDETATVFKGKTLQLTPTFTPEDATQTVTWSSDNESVATVSTDGTVTGIAYGTANITVTSTLNTEATATCVVTVTAPLITEAQNLDFAEGPVISNHIRTYAKDIQGSDVSGLQEVTGWTIQTNGDARAAGVMTYGSNYGVSSNDSKYFAPGTGYDENSNGNALGIVAVWDAVAQYTQNIRLEAGLYTIKIPVYNQDGTGGIQKNLIGFVEDGGVEHFASTTSYPVDQWTEETISFVLTQETYGYLSVGYDGNNIGNGNAPHLWIDRIVVENVETATPADYTALNEAIDAAEAKTLGFDAEEYAPYNNVEALEALAIAKDLDQEAKNSKTYVNELTMKLGNWTANTEEVNAVYNKMFAIVHAGANYPEGWTRTNGWGQMRADIEGDYHTAYYNQPGSLKYGESGVYTMPLKANTAYCLNFAYRSHENNSNNGVTVSVLNGEDGLSNKELEGNGSTTDWKTATVYFTTGAAGNYVLTLANNGNTWMTNVSIFRAVAEEVELLDAATEAPAETYANVTYNRQLLEGWNSLVLPFDVTKEELGINESTADDGERVIAYSGTTKKGENDYTINFERLTEDVLAANTPYMIKKATDGTNMSFAGKIISPVAEPKVADETGAYDFVGTYVAIAKDENKIKAGDLTVGASQLNKAKAAKAMKAFRAFFRCVLPAEEALNARITVNIDGQETDAITAVEIFKTMTEGIYNLQGQKVNKAQKGVYIVNGKKVVIK